MSLKRALIRQHVFAALLNNTDVGGNVYDTRITPFFDHDMPAINIAVIEERNDEQTGGASRVTETLRVTLLIGILVSTKPDANIADSIDTICEQVHGLIDPRMGGLVQRATYQGTTIQFDPSGKNATATAVMSYDILFMND